MRIEHMHIAHLAQRFRFNPALFRVAKEMLLLFLAAHVVGSLWFLVGTEEQDRSPGEWGPSSWLHEQHLGLRYMQSFLWGISLMTGFVIFDVEPYTLPEVILTFFGVILGFLVSIIIISSTTSFLHSIDSKQIIGRQRLEVLSTYLRFKLVPAALTKQIVDFFEFQMTSTKTVMQLSDLRELPLELAMRLTCQINRRLLTECPLFVSLPADSVLHLLHSLRPVVYTPTHVLIHENTQNNTMFFINNGSVNVWRNFNSPARKQLLATLSDNDFFGEASLMTGAPATATVQCISFCDMLVLSREQFKTVTAHRKKMGGGFSDVVRTTAKKRNLTRASTTTLSGPPARRASTGSFGNRRERSGSDAARDSRLLSSLANAKQALRQKAPRISIMSQNKQRRASDPVFSSTDRRGSGSS